MNLTNRPSTSSAIAGILFSPLVHQLGDHSFKDRVNLQNYFHQAFGLVKKTALVWEFLPTEGSVCHPVGETFVKLRLGDTKYLRQGVSRIFFRQEVD